MISVDTLEHPEHLENLHYLCIKCNVVICYFWCSFQVFHAVKYMSEIANLIFKSVRSFVRHAPNLNLITYIKHKEGLRTLVESSRPSDKWPAVISGIFWNWLSLQYKTCFISQLFLKKFIKSRRWLGYSTENARFIWQTLPISKNLWNQVICHLVSTSKVT